MRTTTLFGLLKRRFGSTREKELYASILCGEVWLNGERSRDPRKRCGERDRVEIKAKSGYVSRGGEKLAGALAAFRFDCRGKTFLDGGASTGGFTDCLLRKGARLVYAVDVGYAQFDWRLRRDPRVTLMERTNVMDLTRADFPDAPHAAVVDLSFRSLRLAAARVLGLTAEGLAIALVKPQFEWLNPPPDFDGVVRENGKRREILLRLAADLEGEAVHLANAVVSPLEGVKGNIEYFFLLARDAREGRMPAGEMIDSLFGG